MVRLQPGPSPSSRAACFTPPACLHVCPACHFTLRACTLLHVSLHASHVFVPSVLFEALLSAHALGVLHKGRECLRPSQMWLQDRHDAAAHWAGRVDLGEGGVHDAGAGGASLGPLWKLQGSGDVSTIANPLHRLSELFLNASLP